jgi:hypothetical protein
VSQDFLALLNFHLFLSISKHPISNKTGLMDSRGKPHSGEQCCPLEKEPQMCSHTLHNDSLVNMDVIYEEVP